MKKIIATLSVIALTGSLVAGGVQQNTNQSAEWAQTGNRNASIAADSTFYNPAGTAFLADGLHLYVSNQVAGQTRTAKVKDGKTYKSDVISPLIPNAYGVYKTGAMAISAGFLVVGGGGSVDFADALPSMYNDIALAAGAHSTAIEDISLKSSSAYLGGVANFAYAINDMFAASVGGTYYYAKNTTNGSVSFNNGEKTAADFEETGSSYGVILGLDVKPTNKINVGLRYQWNDVMALKRNYTKEEATVHGNTAISGITLNAFKDKYTDGATVYATLPQMIALGAEYKVSDKLSIQPNFTYYVNTLTQWGKKNYHDGYDAGLGADWQCMFHAPLRMGAGFFYTKNGAMNDAPDHVAVEETASGLDSWTFNLGGRYTVSDALEATLAGSYTMYNTTDIDGTDPATITVSKSNWAVALGVGYKMDLGSANAAAADMMDKAETEANEEK